MADQVLPPRRRPATSCLPGERYGRWTVIGDAPKRGSLRYVNARCACGTERAVMLHDLIVGRSRSCGCLSRETTAQRNRTHGMAYRHPLYGVWMSMRTRCNNPHSIGFHNYGGRGIKICAQWNSFQSFLDDMGPTYRPGLTLERIDNNAGYYPENCCWATPKEQARNQRKSRFIETPWGIVTVAEAAERSGVPYDRLRRRLRKGWPKDRLFILQRSLRQLDTPFGRLTMAAAVVRSGLSESTLRQRVRLGWPVTRLFAPRRGVDRTV
jgi:hypothetical protein